MLQFVREIPLRVVLQGTLSSRRGFLFHMAAGFSKDIDELSGMSVNLLQVDQWLQAAAQAFTQDEVAYEGENLTSPLGAWASNIRNYLAQQANFAGAVLTSLTFREERGWSFAWNSELNDGQMLFTYAHFIETLPPEGEFDLLKIHFTWLRQVECQEDYQYQGFKLLKSYQVLQAPELPQKLFSLVGHTLHSGTKLQAVQIIHVGQQFALQAPG